MDGGLKAQDRIARVVNRCQRTCGGCSGVSPSLRPLLKGAIDIYKEAGLERPRLDAVKGRVD